MATIDESAPKTKTHGHGETPLTPEQMKAAIQRFIDEALNKGDLSVVDDSYSQDLIDNDGGHPHLGRGWEEGRNEIMMYRTGFPDIHQTIHDMIVEDDRVAHRWTTTGTHTGVFLGIKPTGKKVEIKGMTVSRFGPDGKIHEIWNFHDRLAFLEQLGTKGFIRAFWAKMRGRDKFVPAA
jgi:steroid delta-isomerase-like uncharacterized protein